MIVVGFVLVVGMIYVGSGLAAKLARVKTEEKIENATFQVKEVQYSSTRKP
ncbi:hypothetical protein HanRHA438_Chr04g0159171 [Helianthus annuus]|nr:hypothetical protein HanHA300_Chr04g0122711 [Helianthus annuus]KAJ0595759.1 hypothetical protein HanHA89_Chr04g0135101 [Helianthus annuus]KAJ0925384.1 hypothetical protein HanRHA438_Chr04g0159171 [Helianthus annuus]